MNRLMIDVDNLAQVLKYYDKIKVYRADSEEGTYEEITDENTRITLEEEQEVYYFSDDSGTDSHWYKTNYFNSQTQDESDYSAPRQGGTEAEKIGYSFENYAAPPDEWGVVLTADDLRYTYLFGIDAVGSDVNESEWTDEQFRFYIESALADFERWLSMDIRKKVYKTNPDPSLKRAPKWIEGVDYTDEENTYPFDPAEWRNYGFLQLRHYPVISVERAIMYSPVKGEVMDLKERNWIRLQKQFGQIHFFPTTKLAYGPYAISGMPWILLGHRFPDGFEIDYTTGYPSSDFVPEDLRQMIGMWAAVYCLDSIGDGLLAGFSSQSVSLDGLSESFSSTQSATSAYFGARIVSYTKKLE
ncbi:MAG: hypothetical protein JRI77_11730, partial [Deltaproteobacteria bacterium]|nr:hypothetical protein [Deltaproteobacteria bacterium]